MLSKLKLFFVMVFSSDLQKSREAEITLFGGGLTKPPEPKK